MFSLIPSIFHFFLFQFLARAMSTLHNKIKNLMLSKGLFNSSPNTKSFKRRWMSRFERANGVESIWINFSMIFLLFKIQM